MFARAKFCHECGFELNEAVGFNQQSTGGTLRPKLLTGTHEISKAIRQRYELAAMESKGSRRKVVVMFADINGFTTLCEKKDAEEVTEILNSSFAELGKIIDDHGGYIDKFIGDCIMAVFGAPVSNADDADQSVLAALALRKSLAGINKKISLELSLSIGLNFGQVVAGGIGTEQKFDYTVIGDAVNVAQRLQSLAGPNQILISESLTRELKNKVNKKSLGKISLKGKSKEIEAFELLENEASEKDIENLKPQQISELGSELRSILESDNLKNVICLHPVAIRGADIRACIQATLKESCETLLASLVCSEKPLSIFEQLQHSKFDLKKVYRQFQSDSKGQSEKAYLFNSILSLIHESEVSALMVYKAEFLDKLSKDFLIFASQQKTFPKIILFSESEDPLHFSMLRSFKKMSISQDSFGGGQQSIDKSTNRDFQSLFDKLDAHDRDILEWVSLAPKSLPISFLQNRFENLDDSLVFLSSKKIVHRSNEEGVASLRFVDLKLKNSVQSLILNKRKCEIVSSLIAFLIEKDTREALVRTNDILLYLQELEVELSSDLYGKSLTFLSKLAAAKPDTETETLCRRYAQAFRAHGQTEHLIECLRLCSKINLLKKNYDKAFEFISVCLDLAQKSGLKELEVSIRLTIGNLHMLRGELDQSRVVLNETKQLSDSLSQFGQSSKIEMNLGMSYLQQKDSNAAIVHFQNACRISSEHSPEHLLALKNQIEAALKASGIDTKKVGLS